MMLIRCLDCHEDIPVSEVTAHVDHRMSDPFPAEETLWDNPMTYFVLGALVLLLGSLCLK